MHTIRVDPEKNRLYITLEGFSTIEQVKAAERELREAANNLKPGFDLVNDISNYKPGTSEIVVLFRQIQEMLKNAGMGRVIRVVKKYTITDLQFVRTAKDTGYNAVNVSSVEEADAILDKPA
jgi:hypothetical protein